MTLARPMMAASRPIRFARLDLLGALRPLLVQLGGGAAAVLNDIARLEFLFGLAGLARMRLGAFQPFLGWAEGPLAALLHRR